MGRWWLTCGCGGRLCWTAAVRCRQEGVVDRRKDAELRLAVDLNAAEEPAQMPAQFAAFKQLLADDTDDYSAAHIAAGLAPPSGKGRKPRQPRAGADGEGGPARAGAAALPPTVPPRCRSAHE